MLDFCRKDGLPIFYADSGDLHLKYPEMTRAEEREFRIKAKLFRKVHEKMGLDAQGVGDLDLAIGWPFLKENWEGSSIPLICANLHEKKSGKLPFRPWVIVEKEGIRVAFIGLLSRAEDARLPAEIDELLEVSDPDTALQKAIKELDAEKPDLLVLLSHLGKDEELRIAREVPGLDVILGGHSGDILHAPLESAGVVVVQSGRRGKRLGRLDLWFNPDGDPGAEEYIDFAKAPRKKKSEFKKKLAYTNRIQQLKKKLEFDDEIENWVKEYKEEIQALPALDGDDGMDGHEGHDHAGHDHGDVGHAAPVIDRFWGSDTCSKCHLQQAEWWENTTHAHAYQTLVKVKSEKRADCIACHSVGYKDPGGFDEPAKVGKFKNVGCESCHGRGDHHGQEGKFNTGPKVEKTCTVCHNAERDPEWDMKKVPMIACPSLEVAPVGVPVPENFMKPKGRALYDPNREPSSMDGH